MIWNYLDLFSGCGGFRKGLEEAGFEFGYTGHSEIDKHAENVYQYHYPDSEVLGDVRTIKLDGLPKLDLITFGFPCQDVSVAGKGGGIEASRSGLFFEAMQIIRATRPRYFIFENVKGLFSSNERRDWFTVLREVANSGYDGQWQLLNTGWFLPQVRERIYFIGHVRGKCRPQVFPIGESDKEIIKKGLIQVGNVDTKGHNSIWGRVYDPRGYAPTLNSGGGGMGAKTGLYVVPVLTPERKEKRQINNRIRRLTPMESERIQGFPDNWTQQGISGYISDLQRYKMTGNAVSVPASKTIGGKLL